MALTTDSHTNGLDLTNNASTPAVDAKINQGAEFTALNSQSLSRAGASSSLLSFAGSFTITAWVYLYDLLATYAVLGKGTATPDTLSMEYYLAYNVGSGLWQFQVGNGSSEGIVESLIPAVPNEWTFLTGRHDSIANTIEITVNDPSTGGVSQTYISGSYNSGYDFAIGKYGIDTGGYMNGIVDEVGVFDGLLTDAQLLLLWNSGAGLTYPFT